MNHRGRFSADVNSLGLADIMMQQFNLAVFLDEDELNRNAAAMGVSPAQLRSILLDNNNPTPPRTNRALPGPSPSLLPQQQWQVWSNEEKEEKEPFLGGQTSIIFGNQHIPSQNRGLLQLLEQAFSHRGGASVQQLPVMWGGSPGVALQGWQLPQDRQGQLPLGLVLLQGPGHAGDERAVQRLLQQTFAEASSRPADQEFNTRDMASTLAYLVQELSELGQGGVFRDGLNAKDPSLQLTLIEYFVQRYSINKKFITNSQLEAELKELGGEIFTLPLDEILVRMAQKDQHEKELEQHEINEFNISLLPTLLVLATLLEAKVELNKFRRNLNAKDLQTQLNLIEYLVRKYSSEFKEEAGLEAELARLDDKTLFRGAKLKQAFLIRAEAEGFTECDLALLIQEGGKQLEEKIKQEAKKANTPILIKKVNRKPGSEGCNFSLLLQNAERALDKQASQNAMSTGQPIIIQRVKSGATTGAKEFSIYGYRGGKWQETKLTTLLPADRKILESLSFKKGGLFKSDRLITPTLCEALNSGHPPVEFSVYGYRGVWQEAFIRLTIKEHEALAGLPFQAGRIRRNDLSPPLLEIIARGHSLMVQKAHINEVKLSLLPTLVGLATELRLKLELASGVFRTELNKRDPVAQLNIIQYLIQRYAPQSKFKEDKELEARLTELDAKTFGQTQWIATYHDAVKKAGVTDRVPDSYIDAIKQALLPSLREMETALLNKMDPTRRIYKPINRFPCEVEAEKNSKKPVLTVSSSSSSRPSNLGVFSPSRLAPGVPPSSSGQSLHPASAPPPALSIRLNLIELFALPEGESTARKRAVFSRYLTELATNPQDFPDVKREDLLDLFKELKDRNGRFKFIHEQENPNWDWVRLLFKSNRNGPSEKNFWHTKPYQEAAKKLKEIYLTKADLQDRARKEEEKYFVDYCRGNMPMHHEQTETRIKFGPG